MNAVAFTESVVEEAALAWLRELGYATLFGPEIAPGEPAAERESFAEPFLPARLRAAIARLNPSIPSDALDEAYRRVTHVDTPQLLDANHVFHTLLVDGVSVEYLRSDGTTAHDLVRLIDFGDVDANDFVARSVRKLGRGFYGVGSDHEAAPRARACSSRDRVPAGTRPQRDRDHAARR